MKPINWADEIAKGTSFKASYYDKNKIDIALQFYRGFQTYGVSEESLPDMITINLMFSQIESIIPTLLPSLPHFLVNIKSYFINDAKAEDLKRQAEIRQAAINHFAKMYHLHEKMSVAILDAFFSFGCIKISIFSDLRKSPNAGQPLEGFEGAFVPENVEIEKEVRIERVNPRSIVFDPYGGTEEETWRWVAQKNSITAGQLSRAPALFQALEADKKDPGDVVHYFEIYDLVNKQFVIFCAERQRVVWCGPIPLGINGHPFVFLRFSLDPDSPYPVPLASQALSSCHEFNILRSRLSVHNKRFSRLVQYMAAANEDEDLTLQNIDKLAAGRDGTILNTAQQTIIKPIDFPGFPNASYSEIGLLKQDVAEILGVHRETRSDTTATEISAQMAFFESKQNKKINAILSALVKCAEKLDFLIKKNIDRDIAIKTSGKYGDKFLTVTSQEFSDDRYQYAFEVDVTSVVPKSPQVEQRNFLGLLQILGQSPQLLASDSVVQKIGKLFNINDEKLLAEVQELGLSQFGTLYPEAAQNMAVTVLKALQQALGAELEQEQAEQLLNVIYGAIMEAGKQRRPKQAGGLNNQGTPIGGKDEALTILGSVLGGASFN